MLSKSSSLLCCLLVLLGTTGFGPPAFGTGEPFAAPLGSSDLAALATAPSVPTAVTAAAATIVSASDGHALVSRNADIRLAPASLTKLMTALVALDRASLDRPIYATERSRTEPAVIGLDPGDVLSLEDILYGLLLVSGNDAALAIAETVGDGSITQFVAWMNQRASTMGLRNTHFMNPHGLDQEGHYSSANDMAEVARAAFAEPRLARILSTNRHVVPGPPLYLFTATNPLLGVYPGLDAGKTGFTDAAGRCLVAAATRDGQRLISVVLNSPDISRETTLLLDAGFAMTRRVGLLPTYTGFAGVRPGPLATDVPALSLAGWEAPFIRTYTARGRITMWMPGWPMGSWAQ
ncbi:MAG: Serine-type D-Ala-D-Ala carboxypeptidase [Chloroflexi bacterium]|nr:Serine-type D-Ala-D-Ala carboxypeptidase [Chloroflexota bacterium]